MSRTVDAPGASAVLGWPVGTRLRAEVVGRSVVLRVDDSDRARTAGADLTLRAKIGLPVAVRHLCAIEPGSVVVLAALVWNQLLIVHPQAQVARRLRVRTCGSSVATMAADSGRLDAAWQMLTDLGVSLADLRIGLRARPPMPTVAEQHFPRRPGLAARDRSRQVVRVAPPAALIRVTSLAIFVTAAASSPTSVG